MSQLDAAFERCRAEGRAAFIPFLMAGDPDLATTARLLPALVRGGADVVEVGVPFSDPIADGPVNQRAANRALAAGTTLRSVLDLVAAVRPSLGAPLVLFTYFNPVHAFGVVRFARAARRAGVDGVLCVDLPPEEGEALGAALTERGVDPIYLVAPTSTPARIRRAEAAGRGFLYFVARAGVTGERSRLPAGLAATVRRLRRRTARPVAVGFGVSTPQQVGAVGRIADGVVVGSALVSWLEAQPAGADLAAGLELRVRSLLGGHR
jgi:tryptophan synthase alpha chain